MATTFSSIYLILVFALYFIFCLCAGLRATRQTGRKRTDALAGFLTGFFSSLVFIIVNIVYTLANLDAIRNALIAATRSSKNVNPGLFTNPFNVVFAALLLIFIADAFLILFCGSWRIYWWYLWQNKRSQEVPIIESLIKGIKAPLNVLPLSEHILLMEK